MNVAVTALTFIFCLGAFASDMKLEPRYDYTSGGGAITLKEIKSDSFQFEIGTANDRTADVCSFAGTAKRVEQADTYESKADGCRLTFRFHKNSVNIDGTDACDEECGRTASYTGDYFVRETKCSEGSMARRKEAFKEQFATERYGLSHETLTQLLTDCGKFYTNPEYCWAQSDLALSAFKSGDSKLCLKHIADCRKRMGPEGKLAKALSTNEHLCQNEK